MASFQTGQKRTGIASCPHSTEVFFWSGGSRYHTTLLMDSVVPSSKVQKGSLDFSSKTYCGSMSQTKTLFPISYAFLSALCKRKFGPGMLTLLICIQNSGQKHLCQHEALRNLLCKQTCHWQASEQSLPGIHLNAIYIHVQRCFS